MYAKWIGKDIYCGGPYKRVCIIKKGDVRKVLAKHVTNGYILQGMVEGGTFGWVNPKDIRILKEIKENGIK